MKKVFILLFIFLGFSHVYAQEVSPKSVLQKRILNRDTLINKLNKKELPDSLRKQIADYRSLTEILMSETESYSTENQNLKNELHKFLILITSDTLIYHQDFYTIKDIPTCLQERIGIVRSIIDLRGKIVVAESIAQELERKLGNSPIAYAAIREKIEKNLDEIQSLILKIKEMNLSSLSGEQQNYFRPGLTDRYNNFKKYF
jgi:hypothetical protein